MGFKVGAGQDAPSHSVALGQAGDSGNGAFGLREGEEGHQVATVCRYDNQNKEPPCAHDQASTVCTRKVNATYGSVKGHSYMKITASVKIKGKERNDS